MVRRINLLSGLAIVVFLLSATSALPARAATAACPPPDQRAGICTSGSSDGSGVTVVGTIDQGHRGSGPTGGRDGAGSSGPGHTLTAAELQALRDELCATDGLCDLRGTSAVNPRVPPGTPAAAVPAVAITIRDLARFLPATAALHAEPNGWAVVGVPANFWVDVAAVTVDGSLLGETAQVRFTPEAYRFTYGDGTTRATATSGSSWAALGQPELTATPTSHVYRDRGDRRATITVVYSAEYRLGTGAWTAVAGAVSGTTPPQRVLVVAERTALTAPGRVTG